MVGKTVKGTLLATGMTLIGVGSSLLMGGETMLIQGVACFAGGAVLVGLREVVKDEPLEVSK